jgi:hypothetical protein
VVDLSETELRHLSLASFVNYLGEGVYQLKSNALCRMWPSWPQGI